MSMKWNHKPKEKGICECAALSKELLLKVLNSDKLTGSTETFTSFLRNTYLITQCDCRLEKCKKKDNETCTMGAKT